VTPRDRGFTLLEVLVALTVLGFILAGLSTGAQYGLLAAGSQGRTVAATGDLDAVDRALTRLVQGMDPGRNRGPPPLRGSSGSMAFTSALPTAALLPTRSAEVVLLVEGGHLVLRAVSRQSGQRTPSPVSIELLRGVERIEASYWKSGPQPGWVRTWDGRGLPALVRVRLIFPASDPRRWPDIVVAPMRASATPGEGLLPRATPPR